MAGASRVKLKGRDSGATGGGAQVKPFRAQSLPRTANASGRPPPSGGETPAGTLHRAHSHPQNPATSNILSSQGPMECDLSNRSVSGPTGSRFPGRTDVPAPPSAPTSFTATNSLTLQPPPTHTHLLPPAPNTLSCSRPQTHLHPPLHRGSPKAPSHPYSNLGLPPPASPSSTRPWGSLRLEPIS